MTAPAPAPASTGFATVEDVEDLLADLQLQRAGLTGRSSDPAADRAAELADETAFLGLSPLVADLLGTSSPAPRTTSALSHRADEDDRRASYETWRAEARTLLPELWQWLNARRRSDQGRMWWCRSGARPVPETSARLLAETSAPVRDLAPLAESWARPCGVREPTAEHNWRWLLLGTGLQAPLPRPYELITKLVDEARGHGLLPPAHKVKVIRRAHAEPSAVPVRLPGFSLLTVPTAVAPATIPRLQHEIARIAEHAVRPPRARLADRWSFDPVRSEGWGLLLAGLVTAPGPLVRLGLPEQTAAAVTAFLAEEEHATRSLLAADLALAADLGACNSTADALVAAASTTARTGLQAAPELMLLRQTRILDSRARLAGYAWRDEVTTELTARFGTSWSHRTEAWQLLVEALSGTGTAADFLHTVRSAPKAPHPVVNRMLPVL
ncbi:hypothetical protein ACFQVC_39090 [Streptomyces monticola]|uniref:Uncharacterized protein n=1 Tax=Streptomyces monticola TaxID=2666263 RepID=A0ABW2JXF2_9ACTN